MNKDKGCVKNKKNGEIIGMRPSNLIKRSQQVAGEIRTVEKLYRHARYEDVVKKSDRILARYPGLASLMVLRGMAIQLLETDQGIESYPTLRDAENSLEAAVQLDPSSIEALNELAFFHFAVLDNNHKALRLFRRGMALSFEQLKKVLIGFYKTALYTGKFQQARQALKTLKRIFPRDREIDSLKNRERKRGQGRKKRSA